MRRRPKSADDPTVPPPQLLTFTGTTNRERFAWLLARDEWWRATHPDPDAVGSLQWVIDGHDEVGDFPCCGSIGTPCDDPDCLCTTWPQYLAATPDPHHTSPGSALTGTTTERNYP